MSDETTTTDLSPRGVATVTLNRPERGNAIDQRMLDEIAAHLRRLAADDGARVLVLRGAGRHFSSGADMSRPKEAAGAEPRTSFADIFLALETWPKPTLAIVHGACVGGAAGLAACCDIVLAGESAFFSIPEVRIGVAPIGIVPVLVRAMGLGPFRRYALSGERIAAAEAQRIGLAHEVCADGALERRAGEIIDALLHGAPGAQRALKEHLRAAFPTVEAQLRAAGSHHARGDTFKSPEALEGVAAFKERRKPAWYRA